MKKNSRYETRLTANRRAILVACLTVAAGMALGAQPSADAVSRKIQAVDALFSVVNGSASPGAAVAVLQDDTTLLLKGYGMADVSSAMPITPQTRFRIGSVTKPFTAIAVLQLVEIGKLSLDDSIDKFLPDLPFGGQVKVEHLLSHTAGVPDFIPEDAAKRTALEFEPGSRINYSNTGYHMLGRIIERVTGGTWEQCIRTQILAPLGMENTGFDNRRELAGRAAGYRAGADGGHTAVDLGDAKGAYAAGGVYSTAEDMLRLARGIRDGKLLSKEMLELATAPRVLSDGRHVVYGLGWMTREYKGLREVSHGGDIGGFNAYLALYPDEGYAVAVLSNVEMRPPGRLQDAGALAHKIVDVWLADELASPAQVQPVRVPVETLDRYVGRYRIEAPETIRRNMGDEIAIRRDGNGLRAEANGRDVALVADSTVRFRSPNSPVELVFVCEDSGNCPKVVISLLGLREFHAVRIVAQTR
ncbi:MAG: serine hydrolase [Bryobacterales bacterium]|nr:serine hydrolase [Bryobacterales bacterium]